MTDKSAHKFGAEAEQLAAEYLQSRGYEILERRYRFNRKEIDIIARRDKTIAFVEVKADRTGNFGPPESWVTPAKQKNIMISAQGYISEHDCAGYDFRFDVITCKKEKSGIKLNHLKGAFYAEENPE